MELEISTSDGASLSGSYFPPEGTARGAVLIVPAMGVSQAFYSPFCRWLASQGFGAMTFDYRGMGRSLRRPLRHENADILTWARGDTEAAVRALRAQLPKVPITWFGHSLGGQIVPFVDERQDVAKIVTVATGSGYWLQNAPPLKRKVWLFWFVMVPLATPLFGYFPGQRLHMVADLPRNVVRQWRSWCLHREYVVGVVPGARELFASVKTPVTSISFTDDELMSAENIASIHGFYTSAPRTMIRLEPREVGRKRVGHFGFFRQELREALWQPRVLPELATA